MIGGANMQAVVERLARGGMRVSFAMDGRDWWCGLRLEAQTITTEGTGATIDVAMFDALLNMLVALAYREPEDP